MHTQRPPHVSLGFSLFLPRSPPRLRSSLPGLTSTFVLLGFPLFYFCNFNLPPRSVFTTHTLSLMPPPSSPTTLTASHQTWVQNAGKEGNWKVPPQSYFLPKFNLDLLSARPQTSQRPLHRVSSLPEHCLCTRAAVVLDLGKKKKKHLKPAACNA